MAAPASIARRNAIAANRTKDATRRIGDALGIALVPVTPSTRGDAAFAHLSEREAVTENLQRIAAAVEASQRGSEPSKDRKGVAPAATKGETDGEPVQQAVPEVAGP